MKALSFFSGIGGLDLGFHEAGIETLLFCENDKHCQRTLHANHPHTPILPDITTPNLLHEIRERIPETPDIVYGGPPCQAFSTAGKRQGFTDARGNVFLTYLHLATHLKPPYIVIENVRGLLSAPAPTVGHPHKGGALEYTLTYLRDAGYTTTFTLYNTAHYGVPQTRERIILIATLNPNPVPLIAPTHRPPHLTQCPLPEWRTFRDVAEQFPENIRHEHVNHPANRLAYYAMLQPGQNWKHLPPDMQKQALGKSYHSQGGKTGFYRRLDWDKPSPTLLTHPAMFATALTHPTEPRPLSVQEYQRVQQIPDDYVIAGKTTDKYRQLGNAVPAGFAKAIARAIARHAENPDVPNIDMPPAFPYSRYKNTSHLDYPH